MFTGIVTDKAVVNAIIRYKESCRMMVELSIDSPVIGESISVNGVCLTLTSTDGHLLQFDISPETLSRTTLAQLQTGDEVNIERAMRGQDRFGGHYVSGHVDRTSRIHSIESRDIYTLVKIIDFTCDEFMFLPEKGSICIDGVSLTINRFTGDGIEVMLIPHTLQETTLHRLKPNDRVNIEFDYIARLISHQQALLNNTMKEEAL